MSVPCSSYISCTNCTAFACIWCGNDAGGCHAEFSPYGCLTAVPCPDLLECKRKTPENIAYNELQPVTAIVIAVIAFILLIGIWIFWYFFMDYRRKKLQLRTQYLVDMEMDTLLNSFNTTISNTPVNKKSSASLLSNENISFNTDKILYLPISTVINKECIEIESILNTNINIVENENNDEIKNLIPFECNDGYHRLSSTNIFHQSQCQKINEYQQHLHAKYFIKKSNDCLIRITFGCAICSTFIILIFSAALAITFPTKPYFNICNQEMDWWTIWSSLEHGSIQLKYNTLISVKNSNYFGVELRNTGARFYHQQSLIGYWYPEKTYYLSSHSITDIMADITFAPGITQAYELYALYEENNLKLEVNFFADVSAFLFDSRNIKMLGMYLNIHMNDFVIGTDIETDREYCACAHD